MHVHAYLFLQLYITLSAACTDVVSTCISAKLSEYFSLRIRCSVSIVGAALTSEACKPVVLLLSPIPCLHHPPVRGHVLKSMLLRP